jgi:N utilization substance protein A
VWYDRVAAVVARENHVSPLGHRGWPGGWIRRPGVVQELRGEKIDIVPWDKDPARYIINAIQPAEVNKVIVDEADHRMELVVPEEKLSLAIGRKGQNVRLASQLTGWRLDIISEAKFIQMEEEALVQLREIEGIGDDLAKSMYRLGFRALEEVAEAAVEELVTIDGIADAERAQGLKSAASAAMERVRQERIERATSRTEPLDEGEKLRFLQGIGQRTVQLLEDAGYRRVDDLAREDPDRLAIRTGLGIKKARQIHESARHFLTDEWKVIEEARARHSVPAEGVQSE